MYKFQGKNNLQPDAKSIPERLWDVVIIGAGPTGAIAATHLAANRHQVLLLDRKKFPREKICGDGLLNNALGCLDNIGVIDTIQSTGRQMRFCSLFSPSQHEVQIPGKFLTLQRSLLDKIVVQKAVELGVFFAHGAVETLSVDPDGRISLSLKQCDRRFSARIAILATGTNIRLVHQLKWPAEKRPSAVALRCYVQSTYSLDRMIVSCDRSIRPGYAWIFPMRDQFYNIGCGISLIHVRKRGFNLKRTFNQY